MYDDSIGLEETALVELERDAAESSVEDLIGHVRWAAQTIHQAYHPSGEWQECPRDLCASSVRAILAAGGRP